MYSTASADARLHARGGPRAARAHPPDTTERGPTYYSSCVSTWPAAVHRRLLVRTYASRRSAWARNALAVPTLCIQFACSQWNICVGFSRARDDRDDFPASHSAARPALGRVSPVPCCAVPARSQCRGLVQHDAVSCERNGWRPRATNCIWDQHQRHVHQRLP